MSIISDIKLELVHIIDPLAKIQDVADYDKQPAKGFPLVTITMAANENKFGSSAQNMRTFLFTITAYEQMQYNVDNPNASSYNAAVERAEHILADVVSDILNVLDDNITLNNTVEYMEAVPSSWGYMETEAGWFRTAQVDVRVNKYYLVT